MTATRSHRRKRDGTALSPTRRAPASAVIARAVRVSLRTRRTRRSPTSRAPTKSQKGSANRMGVILRVKGISFTGDAAETGGRKAELSQQKEEPGGGEPGELLVVGGVGVERAGRLLRAVDDRVDVTQRLGIRGAIEGAAGQVGDLLQGRLVDVDVCLDELLSPAFVGDRNEGIARRADADGVDLDAERAGPLRPPRPARSFLRCSVRRSRAPGSSILRPARRDGARRRRGPSRSPCRRAARLASRPSSLCNTQS